MSFSLVSLLLDVVASLFAGAALMRLYMNHQRIPMSNPIGQLVLALTNWSVLPMRRLLPAMNRLDLPSLLLALAVLGVHQAILMLWVGGGPLVWLQFVLVNLVQLVVSMLTVLLLAYALGSWFRMDAQIYALLGRICEPVLAPVRRVLPRIGGIDFSPMVVVLLAQVLTRMLGYWQAQGMLSMLGMAGV